MAHENDDRFYRYPTEELVAVLPADTDVDAVLADLDHVGTAPEAVDLLHGEVGAQLLDRGGRRHGLLARLARLVQSVGFEGESLLVYDKALRGGSHLIAVPAADPAARASIAAVLIEHGGRDLYYYGRYGVTDVTPRVVNPVNNHSPAPHDE